MNWVEWESQFLWITKNINLSFERDLDAANILNRELEKIEVEETITRIAGLIDNNICHVFGCGPSLEVNLREILKSKIIKNQDVIIAADGATKAFLINDIAPDIIVTDFDGDLEAIIEANKRGSIIVIHAHGDNLDKIQKFSRIFKRKIGTVQVKPFGFLKNFGGFTDGDRCVFLAEHFNARKIFLYGFDFGNIVGKYSKPGHKNNFKADEIKLKKLEIAESLINMLNEKRIVKIVNSTSIYVDSTKTP